MLLILEWSATGMGNLADSVNNPDASVRQQKIDAFTQNIVSTVLDRGLPFLLNFAANRLGLGDLPTRIRNIIQFIPNTVDDLMRRVVSAVAGDRVNVFLTAAGLPALTLDGIDRGTQQMTMPNPTTAFRNAVDQFYRQRGWYMGTTVHNQVAEYYGPSGHPIAGLEYQTTGPDFRYRANANDPYTYFELLTATRHSRQKHDDRHGGYLWRAVYYSFGANAPDVSDIE